MSAKQFFLSYATITVNGIAQPGATLTFYQTGTLTKLPVYTTSLLNVTQTNPVVASGAGRIPTVYLDGTQTYRVITKDKYGAVLDDTGPYIPGMIEGIIVGNASSTANTRAELAAFLGNTTSNSTAFLSEPGREGMFVWATGDQSAMVTADSAQGIYVAPAADTTGAAGAWVRKFSGKADVKWFTGVPDGVTGNAANINAALACLNAMKMTTSYGYSKGSPGLFISPSLLPYIIDADINVYHTLEIEWANGAGPSGGAAVWKVNAGVTGIRTHSNTSTGRAGETTNRGYSATGTVLRNPFMVGGFTTTEGEFYGIHLRVKTYIYDPYIEAFQGDGIFGDTSGLDNINGSVIVRPWCLGNRDGIHLNYNNANACHIDEPQCFANRRYGVWSKDNYGCSIMGGNTASNGCAVGFPTQSFNNGHVFGCLPTQEVWAAANPPPATATNNTGWHYLYDAGAATAAVPQWTAAMSIRAGGPIRFDGGSTFGTVQGHEVEGDQMPIQCVGGSKALILGGLCKAIDATGNPWGGHITADGGGIYVNQSIFPVVNNNGAIGVPSERFAGGYFYTLSALTSITTGGTVSGTTGEFSGPLTSSGPTNGLGYAVGAGGAVAQATSRTTGVTLNKVCGAITLFSAAGTATWQTFTVTNSTVAATDTVRVVQKSGTDKNMIHVTNVAAGSFDITFATTGGVTVETPVFNFSVIKAVAA